jgi:hypothetical protein
MSGILVKVSTLDGDKYHSIPGDCGQLQPCQYTRRDTDGVHLRGGNVMRMSEKEAKDNGYSKCANCDWKVIQAQGDRNE